jgi:predicted small lipoprotein YifL
MSNHFKLLSRLLLVLLLGSALLAGCGQKGALYLPDQPDDQEQEQQ